MHTLLMVACVIACQTSSEAGATSEPSHVTALLEKFDQAWRARREESRSARYEVEGTGVIPKTAYAESGNPVDRDHSFPVELNLLLDFAGGRFRVERTDKVINFSTKTVQPDHEIFTYAKDDLRVHHAAVAENRGRFYSDAQPEFTFESNVCPVLTIGTAPPFFAHGYLPLIYLRGDFQSIGPLETRLFDSKGPGEIDGRQCLVLRTKRTPQNMHERLEVWIDVSSAVILRLHKFEGDTLESSADLEYHGDTPERIKGWRSTQFDLATGKPARFYSYTVKRFAANNRLADSEFTQDPKPGMVVRDAKLGRTYMLGAGGEQVPIQVALARKRDEVSWLSRLGTVLVVVAAIFALVGGTWLWKRYGR